MTMNYTQTVAYLENLLVDAAPSSDFTQILPAAIQYSENRIYRELDLLSDRVSANSAAVTVGNRNATCPTNISVVEGISLLSPVGTVPPLATRIPLERSSLDYIDFAYGNEATTGTPSLYAMKSDTVIVLAPTPASAWVLEVTGTGQPEALSETNPDTWLTNNLPDLFLAGCVIFLAGWQQNYGVQGDNSGQSVSWESQFQTLMKSAQEFVQRQKSQDPNWTPYSPTPLSTPRG